MNTPRHTSETARSSEKADRLDLVLRELVVSVAPEFTHQVMQRVAAGEADALPAVDWFTAPKTTRRLLAYPGRLAAGLLAALLGLAGVLAASGGGSTGSALVAALVDFAGTSLAAGGGLLGASWAGVGGMLAAWLGESVWNMLLFGGVVLGLDILFFMMIRRRRSRVAVTADPQGD